VCPPRRDLAGVTSWGFNLKKGKVMDIHEAMEKFLKMFPGSDYKVLEEQVGKHSHDNEVYLSRRAYVANHKSKEFNSWTPVRQTWEEVVEDAMLLKPTTKE
jgi:hypothetical protein